jgi:hypothetical protein
MRMRRIILLFMVCLVVQYHTFPRYRIKVQISEEKLIEHKMCFFDFLYKFFLKNFSFQEDMREVLSYMYVGLRVTHVLFLSDFNKTRIFRTFFRKIQISNFMEI